MKKMIKMSLVAAVAVAGISSTATAKPLEEAIKGVDVSGYVRYRYEDTNRDDANSKASTQNNEYKINLKLKSKVNDMVTANVHLDTGKASTTDTTGDINPTLGVTTANFAVKAGAATVTAGKQTIPGPMIDNTDATKRGTGIVAIVPAGPVTVAAGHFVTHNTDNTTAAIREANATELAVIGKFGPVKADVWYANVTDVVKGYSVHANAKVGPAGIDFRHTNMEIATELQAKSANNDNEATLTKVVASAKVGPASLVAGYAMTGDNNGEGLNRVAIDADNDAKSDFKVWQASVGGLSDASAFLVGASMKAGAKTTVGVKYVTVDFKNGATNAEDADATELLFDASYKMSKNFKIAAKYSMYEADYATTNTSDVDSTKGRLELKYTF